MGSPVQLSLGVALKDEATFANFFEKDANAQVLAALKNLTATSSSEAQNIIIWGAPGCGVTHLLQAVCHDAYEARKSLQYLPMNELIGFDANDICEGLEGIDLVCIDGVDAICGNRSWEHAFFHLYNKIKEAGHTLVFSSHTSPPSLPILLPDLKSRLLASVVYHVESLTDTEKQNAMIMRAQARGMEMSEDVAKYIMQRAPRDTSELFELLDRLDDASLQQQRKLTIPFVKETLQF
ncbi:DnaA regulatory inactivator Hda [Thalassocella blandensis]|nr:DnaA regulatory inactivator Hda [Thalassocella blandensis]